MVLNHKQHYYTALAQKTAKRWSHQRQNRAPKHKKFKLFTKSANLI